MKHDIVLIYGDGIGREVMSSAVDVIESTGVEINWDLVDVGEEDIKNHGSQLVDGLVDKIGKSKIAFKGPLTTQVGGGSRSVNVHLRKKLNLYANIRPIQSFKGVDSLHQNVDLIIVRENTEDLYAGVEHMVGEDAAESIKIITRSASERICRHAFELARRESRKKVSLVHKANIMKLSDGLFLKSGQKIARDYRDIEFEDIIVDAMSMKLVQHPQNYDVILAPNLYGDILSDLSAGLIGGLGLAPGANLGEDTAVFEPVHGSAPDIRGKGIANPISAILSGAMMLKHIGELDAAGQIEDAVRGVLSKGKDKTVDLGGSISTKEFTETIIQYIIDGMS